MTKGGDRKIEKVRVICAREGISKKKVYEVIKNKDLLTDVLSKKVQFDKSVILADNMSKNTKKRLNRQAESKKEGREGEIKKQKTTAVSKIPVMKNVRVEDMAESGLPENQNMDSEDTIIEDSQIQVKQTKGILKNSSNGNVSMRSDYSDNSGLDSSNYSNGSEITDLKDKLIKVGDGFVKASEVTEQDKEAFRSKVRSFRFNAGYKGDYIIHASLIDDKTYSKIGYMTKISELLHRLNRSKISKMRNVGNNVVEVVCGDCTTANNLLNLNHPQIKFYVPNRKKYRKGTVQWDKSMDTMEFIEALTYTDNIISVERLIKRKYDVKTNTTIWSPMDLLIVGWGGDYLPREVSIYSNLTKLYVRPYVEEVRQCYKCFKYGHWKNDCKMNRLCCICGDIWHGRDCKKDQRCANCGGPHRPTNKGCPEYQVNIQVKNLMANDNLSARDAMQVIKNRRISEFQGINSVSAWPELSQGGRFRKTPVQPDRQFNINKNYQRSVGLIHNDYSQDRITQDILQNQYRRGTQTRPQGQPPAPRNIAHTELSYSHTKSVEEAESEENLIYKIAKRMEENILLDIAKWREDTQKNIDILQKNLEWLQQQWVNHMAGMMGISQEIISNTTGSEYTVGTEDTETSREVMGDDDIVENTQITGEEMVECGAEVIIAQQDEY